MQREKFGDMIVKSHLMLDSVNHNYIIRYKFWINTNKPDVWRQKPTRDVPDLSIVYRTLLSESQENRTGV